MPWAKRAAVWAALSFLGCGRDVPGVDWNVRFSHVYTTTSDYQLMAERFRDLMAERTDGRFRVVIYPSGQLGGERVAFEQLQAGAQQMSISGTPVLSGWVPEGQIFDLPFLFTDRDQGLRVLHGPLGDWWQGLLLERTGVRSLGFLDYGFRHVYNTKRPIKEPSDLEGLKLRVLQSPTYLAAYQALGVQATPMNYGEVYSALQQGVIDGGEANVIGFVTDRFYEVGRYFSFTSITYNPITLLINEAFFQSLPEPVRADVTACAAEALAYQSEVARELEREALETMKAENVHISYPDPELFVPLVRPQVWEAVAARLPEGESLLERLERALKEGSVESER
jgi:tripartite ATP-independent transporter DctP family solute receptor